MADLSDYRIKRQFGQLHGLICKLVLIRKYISYVETGLERCREHAMKGFAPVSHDHAGGSVIIKRQEQVLVRLKMAEKRLKGEIMRSSRELARVCSREYNVNT
ncbi:MAG: hypothetical protein ACOY31_05845 [Bacillota bacterium]